MALNNMRWCSSADIGKKEAVNLLSTSLGYSSLDDATNNMIQY